MTIYADFINAISNNQYENVRRYLNDGIDIREAFDRPVRECRDAEILRMLIDAGADALAMGTQVTSTINSNDIARADILMEYDPSLFHKLIESSAIAIHFLKKYPQHIYEILRLCSDLHSVVRYIDENGIHVDGEIIRRLISDFISLGLPHSIMAIGDGRIPPVDIHIFTANNDRILNHLMSIDRFVMTPDVMQVCRKKRWFSGLVEIAKKYPRYPLQITTEDVMWMIDEINWYGYNDYSFLIYLYFPVDPIIGEIVRRRALTICGTKVTYAKYIDTIDRLKKPIPMKMSSYSDMIIRFDDGADHRDFPQPMTSRVDWFSWEEFKNARKRL